MSASDPQAPLLRLERGEDWPRRITVTNPGDETLEQVRVWVMDTLGGYAPQSTLPVALAPGESATVDAPEGARPFAADISTYWMDTTFSARGAWWKGGDRVTSPTTLDQVERRLRIQ